MNLTFIDWTIMLVYFVFVLGIGFLLRRSTRTSTDFFLSGRSLPAWVTGLAFISANLGAQEVIGMGARWREIRHGDQSLLLDRRHSRDGVCGHLHDAVLLRLASPIGAGILETAIR